MTAINLTAFTTPEPYDTTSPKAIAKVFLLVATCYQFVALIYTGSAYILHWTNSSIFMLSGYSIMLSFLIVIPLLLVQGYAATFCFVFFLTQPVFQVFLLIFVLKQEPLWLTFFPEPLIETTLRHTFTLTHYIYLLILVGLLFFPDKPKYPPMLNARPLGAVFAWGIAGSLSLYILAIALNTSRDAYMQSTGGSDRFLFVLGMITVGLGVIWGFSVRGPVMRALGVFCLTLGAAIALSGYRSVLVVVGIASMAIYLRYYRLGAFTCLMAIVGLIVAYFGMSFLNYLRNEDYTLTDIILGQVVIDDWSQVFIYAGRAEQIELFTVAYAESLEKYWGMTYIYSLARVLPNAIGEGILKAPRPQDILVDGGPYAFIESGLNLGAYFYAELALNFGIVGALLITTFVMAMFVVLERNRNQSQWMTLFYPIVATMTPTLAIYGSANFFKQTLTMSAMSLILYLLLRVRFTPASLKT